MNTTIDAILGYTPARAKELAATLDRKEYAALIRRLLKARGITGVSVTLARGTAYGWTDVEFRYVDGESFDDRETRLIETNRRLGFGSGFGQHVIAPSINDRARFILHAAGGWTYDEIIAAIPPSHDSGWY